MARPAPLTRVVLLADPGAAKEPARERVRRYRLARVRFEGRSAEPGSRFEHLKRAYD